MWILLIYGLVVLVFSFVFFAVKQYHIAYLLALIGSFVTTAAVIFLEQDKKPSALNVYQGKTTLEITYKDNIPIDSVVVFK